MKYGPSYNLHLSLEQEQRLQELREQNYHFTEEQLLGACITFGLSHFLEDRGAVRKLRQHIWRETHPTQTQSLIRVFAQLWKGDFPPMLKPRYRSNRFANVHNPPL